MIRSVSYLNPTERINPIRYNEPIWKTMYNAPVNARKSQLVPMSVANCVFSFPFYDEDCERSCGDATHET